MVLEICQLSISDETHLKRLKRPEIYCKIPVSWSFYFHSRSYFQGNFQTLIVERGVRFPKAFPEIYVKAKLGGPRFQPHRQLVAERRSGAGVRGGVQRDGLRPLYVALRVSPISPRLF